MIRKEAHEKRDKLDARKSIFQIVNFDINFHGVSVKANHKDKSYDFASPKKEKQ